MNNYTILNSEEGRSTVEYSRSAITVLTVSFTEVRGSLMEPPLNER